MKQTMFGKITEKEEKRLNAYINNKINEKTERIIKENEKLKREKKILEIQLREITKILQRLSNFIDFL